MITRCPSNGTGFQKKKDEGLHTMKNNGCVSGS